MNEERATEVELTVVVCSYNGADKLGATLEALAEQTLIDQLEVLVVDDGSTDGTERVAREHGVKVVVHSSNKGLCAARNTGVNNALAPLVAFTDDDCRPDRMWAEQLVAAWKNRPEGVVGVGGGVSPLGRDSFVRRFLAANNPVRVLEMEYGGEDDSLTGKIGRYLRAPNRNDTGARFVASLVGANMMFSKEALLSVGGFDETISFGGDEFDLCERLREVLGDEVLWFVPDAVMNHEFEPDLKDTLRRARSYGRGSGREWYRKGGVPSLRPAPLATLCGGVVGAGFGAGGFVLGAAFVPAVLFRHHLRDSILDRDLEKLAWPLVELCQESAGLVGFVQGYKRERARTV